MKRKYMPTFAGLVDELSIVTLKSIKISEHKKQYEKSAQEIMHDLDLIIKEKDIKLTGQMIRAILMVGKTNEMIWANESFARTEEDNKKKLTLEEQKEKSIQQGKLLKFTHSINGVRNLAKNVVSNEIGERQDLKIDCLAADLCKQRGYNFDGIFEGTS